MALSSLVLNKPLGDAQFQALPPTFQRRLALEKFAGSEFAVVQDWFATWAFDSIRAYQHFFPEVNVPWWDYFNTGLTLLSAPI
ncbi:MAG TPA: hypothetical protein VMF91_09645 [Bryobacteraceae bacterium]|nr:hypothetical protein [Bryobacteraceae bacterium]